MTNKQKKKNRNSRDSYGRLLANGWHLEVSRAEININNDGIPIVLSADIHGCDYHGSCFSQTMIPPTQLETHDKRTETHACDCVSRKDAVDLLDVACFMHIEGDQYPEPLHGDWIDYHQTKYLLEKMPSVQPEIVKCKKCRYVYYDKDFDNYWCDRMSGSFKVEADGYCKWGK